MITFIHDYRFKNLSESEKKALSDFKTAVLKRFGDEVVEIRLFGSRARGGGNETSDIDVAIIVKTESGKMRREIYDMAAEFLINDMINISPLIMTTGKFNWQKSIERGIVLAIEEEGITI